MARKFYDRMEVKLTIKQPRGEEIRLTKGFRGNKVYFDLRTWYEDDEGNMKPGKGIAKMDSTMWDHIADALIKRDEDPKSYMYDPKTDIMKEVD